MMLSKRAQTLSLPTACVDLTRDLFRSNMQELIVLFTYGHKPDAAYIQMARTVMHQTSEALQPGRWIVNIIPACKFCFLINLKCHFDLFILFSNVGSGMGTRCWFSEVGEGFERAISQDDKSTFLRAQKQDGIIFLSNAYYSVC